MDINSVELRGVVEDVQGGNTRRGGYWLLVRIRIETDERNISIPVWWFGDDYTLYRSLHEGVPVSALGELRWGRTMDEGWELRVIARVVTIEDEDEERPRRSERNGRNGERRGSSEQSSERTGRSAQRSERAGRRGARDAADEAPF